MGSQQACRYPGCVSYFEPLPLRSQPQRRFRSVRRKPQIEDARLVRTLYRTATAGTDLNGYFIRKGERVILIIIGANHDPARFSCPNQLDVTRLDGGHLTLGAWPHSCVAAGLIHMAAVSITAPLLRRFASAKPARPIEWQGGSGFRSPRSLWVCLTARDD
jgi:cytochrome P450